MKKIYQKVKPEMVYTQISKKDNEYLKNVAKAVMNFVIANNEMGVAHAQDEKQREMGIEAIRKARVVLDKLDQFENPAIVINNIIQKYDVKDIVRVNNMACLMTIMLFTPEAEQFDKIISTEINKIN